MPTFQKRYLFSIALAIFLVYLGSYYAVRRHVFVTFLLNKSGLKSGEMTLVSPKIYYFHKTRELNYLLWYFYCPLHREFSDRETKINTMVLKEGLRDLKDAKAVNGVAILDTTLLQKLGH